MYIKKIINKSTGQDVLPQYTNRKCKKVVSIKGQPLKVKFEQGGYFTHETVELVVSKDDGKRLVFTTNKIWVFV